MKKAKKESGERRKKAEENGGGEKRRKRNERSIESEGRNEGVKRNDININDISEIMIINRKVIMSKYEGEILIM